MDITEGMSGFEPRLGQEIFFPPRPSRPALWTTQPPVQGTPGLTSEGKAAGAWRWPPPPSSADVKNE